MGAEWESSLTVPLNAIVSFQERELNTVGGT